TMRSARQVIGAVLRPTGRTKAYVQDGERERKILLDGMADGAREGRQSFDGELEKLIHAGRIDKEVGLSYASNRTNLQLRLETQSGEDVPSVTPSGKFQTLRDGGKAKTAPAPRPPQPASAMDDLIER